MTEPHHCCPCATPLVYDFTGAAAKLAPVVSESWLRKHFREVPHRKFGDNRNGRVGFTDADIAAILEQYAVAPVRPLSRVAPDGRVTRRKMWAS